MQRIRVKSLALGLLLLGVSSLHAQNMASITGIVTDPTGAVIPGVNVRLENPSTSVSYAAITNSVGSYAIANVRPGPGYEITFDRDGFKALVITGIYLNVDDTRTQNAKLLIGETSQTVQVSAETETITLNTTDATVGNNFEVQELNDLPVQNRDSPSALFYQQPGVTLDGAVTGARVDQSSVTLDGLDVNDEATGQFGAIVGNAPVDSVQEFRGVTAGELSSAGPGGGGQFELVTRSGTNKFHGALVEYHRDTDLEANDWFNNLHGVDRPPLIRNQFGGNLGGPIKRDKAFFFFDWNSRRDTLSNLETRTVPTDAFRNGTFSYENGSGGISTLSSLQVASFDPQGVGFDSALLDVITSRYPHANDFSAGDGGINTAGFRFNAPFPLVENDYVGRIDFSLRPTQKLWGRVTFARENATESAIQFPGDPETHPFLNKSYGWVVGHTWTMGNNKINQALYGITYEDYNFPDTFNKTGINQFSFGGLPSGGTFLSGPYSSAINAQGRTYPIPVIRDDFAWTKGTHQISFGGTFKYINPSGYTILDYNTPTVGLGGHLTSLDTTATEPSLRPSDYGNKAQYDSEFTFALGRYQSVGATFNYDAKGNVVPQAAGSHSHYRYYETELAFGDTWKVTPAFTISYGLRWQNFSVPYEVNGIESLPNIGFNDLFNARLAQSAAGAMGPSTDCNGTVGAGVPCVSYVLGGKANNGPGYYSPQYTDFAPRLAFAWAPTADRKTVFSAGAGVIYDRTVVNAIQYQASQYSYLFQASANEPFGTGDAISSLKADPRFTGLESPPAGPTAPAAISAPYTPFVSGGTPFGLANGQAFNEGVDKNLKTPYSVQWDLGVQHQFPGGFLLKTTYVGRLGRRLLGQADSNQLIEFQDKQSGQLMSDAFAQIALWQRQNPNADQTTVPAQQWFENVLPPGLGAALGYGSNTGIVTTYLSPLPARGDFADTIEELSALGLLPDNVGMGSQFSEFTYYTNLGTSNYHGLLATLHKNAGHGVSFDLNYTWAHSIDNVSVIANAPAIGGYGFICDVVRPESCRGNSDFDVQHYLNGNFVWNLPMGTGKMIAGSAPFWLDEAIGGWQISGLPSWHTGNAYFAASNAFVAGYANNAPAILTGSKSDLAIHTHIDSNQRLWAYRANDAPATADFEGPIGFTIGSRNNLRGPKYFNTDLGLGKTFKIWPERVNLKFRADAFNALNHPSFNLPSNDITESSGLFGVISSTSNSARVLQLALRLEF